MKTPGKVLFAFVDPKDPYMPSVIEGEGHLGPILSLLSAKPFDLVVLLCTPQTKPNADATEEELRHRHPKCQVLRFQLPVSDPKDYSSLMAAWPMRFALSFAISRGQKNSFVFPAELRKCVQLGSSSRPLEFCRRECSRSGLRLSHCSEQRMLRS